MTEVSDLEAILSAASLWDFVDRDRIVLLGTSQGGITSAIAAARHMDKVLLMHGMRMTLYRFPILSGRQRFTEMRNIM